MAIPLQETSVLFMPGASSSLVVAFIIRSVFFYSCHSAVDLKALWLELADWSTGESSWSVGEAIG